MPVAIVNADKGTTVDGKRLEAGAEIAKKLHASKKSFEWHDASAEEAAKGLEDGTYYLTLTLPADFSAKIASSSGDDPTTGALQVRTNDANNYIVGSISRSVFAEVRSAASANASRGFLDKIFVNFSDLHDKTAEAADGADKLKDGAGKAKDGAKELADGLDTAGEKSGELNTGLKKLNSAAGKLETGSKDVADGTQALADKVNGAADKARPFVKDPKNLADTAELVADSAKVVNNHLATFTEKAPAAAALAKKASTGADAYYTKHCVTPGGEPHLASCPDLKKVRDDAAEAAELSGDVSALVKNANGDVGKLRTQLADLEKKARELVDKAPQLAGDLDAAVAKVNALNTGAHKVSTGMAQLHTGLGSATTGSGALSDGVGRLGDGAHRLDGGMYKLVDGTGELAGGLHEGGKIPDYDQQQRDRRTQVMADPIQLANQSLHKAPNYGTGFAPYFIPLSLWVGAMVAYMLIAPLNRRALAAGASPWRVALAGWLPVAGLGAAQMGLLMSVLHWAPGLGLKMAHPALTIAFLMLVTGCFAAIVQWLNAKFGAAAASWCWPSLCSS